jgi:hypothetical protein
MIIGNPIILGGGSGGFTPSDEGKVVVNGALVEQTSVTKTVNGTYDTTTYNEVVVNVPGSIPSATGVSF